MVVKRHARWTEHVRVTLVLGVILAAAAGVYAPFLDHPFQYDDQAKILDNRKLGDPMAYFAAFANPGYSEDAARLVPNLSLSLDWHLFGWKPFGYHLTNLLLHLLNVCLVAFFGRTLLARAGQDASCVPLLAAAIFALHPLQSEAVLYNNARPNLIVTAFYLAALIAVLRGDCAGAARARWCWRAGFALCFGLALLSKELAVTLAVMAPLVRVWFAPEGLRARSLLRRALPAGAALLAIAACVTFATGASTALRDALLGQPGAAARRAVMLLLTIAGQSEMFVRYLGLALVPWPGFLNVDHSGLGHLQDRLWSAGGLVNASLRELVLPFASVGFVFLSLRGVFAWRSRVPFATLCALWPLVTHAPTSLAPRGEVMVEYRTYLPMVGLCLLLAWSIERTLSSQVASPGLTAQRVRRMAPVGVALCALLLVGTAARARDWTTPETLWRDSVQKDPRSPRALTNFGIELAARGEHAEAERLYRRAIAVNPRYAKAYNNLGNLLLDEGRVDEAIEAFHQALRSQADFAAAYSNLGRALVTQGRLADAIAQHELARRYDPASASVLINLGTALATAGRHVEAERHFRRALELAPDMALGHANLGATLTALDRAEEALRHYRRALELNPDLVVAHTNVGVVLAQSGASDEAAVHLERALALEPTSADAHGNLAALLARRGRYDDAIRHYRKALTLRPDFAEAQTGLAAALELSATQDAEPR